MEFKDRFFGEVVPNKGIVITESGIKFKIVELTSITSNKTGWYASGLAKKLPVK